MSAAEHPWAEQVASHALGALPEDERREFEAHLEGCARCRGELEAATSVTDLLVLTPTPVPAPRDLRGRIMAVVESEAELLRAAGPEADRPAPRRRRFGPLTLRPLAAAAASAALALALVAGWVLGDRDEAPERRVIAAQFTDAPGARGSVELEGDRATLRVRDMPGPGRDRVYQLWFQEDSRGAPVPTQRLFMPGRGGQAEVDLPRRAREAYRIYVSSEPSGGSPTGSPSRTPILAATL